MENQTSGNTLIDTFISQGGTLPEKKEPIFIPTWDNEPPLPKPIIDIQSIPVLTYQNISVLIAQPGFGKSSICEAILSKVISRDAPSFGINVDSKKALYIDCERTDIDVHTSWKRMMNRANTRETGAVIFMGMRMIAKFSERKKVIERVLNENPEIDLLIVDGAGDLVLDTNSLMEAVELKAWLRSLTSLHALSILTTLHPNPGDNKPRGHLGSEMLREAQSILIIEKQGEIRKLTTEFKHGKNRNGTDAETFFKWGDNESMMIQATRDDFISQGKEDYQGRKKMPPIAYFEQPEAISKAIDAIVGNEALGYSDFVIKTKQYILENHPGCSSGDNAIKLWISKLVDDKMVIKKDGKRHSIYENIPKLTHGSAWKMQFPEQ